MNSYRRSRRFAGLTWMSRVLLAWLLVNIATHSPVQIGTFKGQLCHFYERLPNVVPDFIYLDGPDPSDVVGAVNGLDFSHRERTVISGDLLLMEPTFVPGLIVLVDGRTNNAPPRRLPQLPARLARG